MAEPLKSMSWKVLVKPSKPRYLHAIPLFTTLHCGRKSTSLHLEPTSKVIPDTSQVALVRHGLLQLSYQTGAHPNMRAVPHASAQPVRSVGLDETGPVRKNMSTPAVMATASA